MSSKVFLLPYKVGSASARAIIAGLGIRGIRLKNSKFRPTSTKTVINWGNSQGIPNLERCTIINTPNAVAEASDKRTALINMLAAGVNVPHFTENKDEAISWTAAGDTVLCRTIISGHSGAGIVIANSPEEVVDAKLYTKYVKKRDEYRVHVFGGRVIDVQRKMRRSDVADDHVDWKIRNHSNGFIYGRTDVAAPEDVITESVLAVTCLGLDFGAVDVIWNEHYQKAYVLEVNTAPGVEGTTLETYLAEFRKLIEGHA